jgi:plasmid segregation protein ParM
MTEPASIIPYAAVDNGFWESKFAYGRAADGSILVDHFPSEIADPKVVPPEARRRDGWVVVVDDVKFFAGKGAGNHLPSSGARRFRDGYSAETGHKALYGCALAYIVAKRCPQARHVKIQNMVVGLPYATFYRDKQALQTACGGTHWIELPGGEKIEVEVQNVRVAPQPMGALFNAAAGAFPEAAEKVVLVCDTGGGTFDYYLTEALIPQTARCGSTDTGMIKLASHVLESIEQNSSQQPKLLKKVDTALRNGERLVTLLGGERDLSVYMPNLEELMAQSLAQMKVGHIGEVDLIIFTGGGAEWTYRAARKHPTMAKYSKLMHVDKDPIFSNVRGFFLRAEQLAAPTGAIAAPAEA